MKGFWMAMESQPQPGRLVISAREAARILRRDVRTVRRMIESGDLHGGATAGPKQKRWYVYADQIRGVAAASALIHHPSSTSVPRAGDDVADLKAQIVTLQEANRLVSASHAVSLAALEHYKAAAEGFRVAADGYRTAADGYRESATNYQAAAEGFHSALELHHDALAQFTTPGHLGDTTDR